MKILFKVTLLFFCVTLSLSGFAQNEIMQHHERDVIYFKGGGKIYGKILTIENNSVEFEMVSGKVVNFQTGTIKKIIQKFDKTGTAKLKFFKKKPYEFKEEGIYNYTYINFPQGYNTEPYYSQVNFRNYGRYWVLGMGIHHVTGKQHNRWFGTGIGLGFDGYELGYGRNILSIYGECRGYMMAERFSPYYSVGLGYGISVTNKNVGILESKGGLYFNPSLGYRFGGSANANFVMSLGYKLQVATFTERQFNRPILTQTYNFNRINTTFGVLF